MPNADNLYSPTGYPWQSVTYGTLSGKSTDSSVQRKTSNAGWPPTVTGSGVGPTKSNLEELKAQQRATPGENVLNKYRSVSYNLTFAALNKSQINDPSSFNPQRPGFIIASTKGKTQMGPSPTFSNVPAPPSTSASSQDTTTYKFVDEITGQVQSNNVVENNVPSSIPNETSGIVNQQNQTRQSQVDSYNKVSSGKYDMYIDNVDIVTLCSYTNDVKTALATEIHFEIVEPYSINGFMEAIQAGALWGGFNDYISGSYALIVDFYGYPDDEGTPDPVLIAEATRVFTVGIINAEIDINNRGTVYKVAVQPVSAKALKVSSSSNTRGMTIKGKSVEEMLKNYATIRNNQNIDDAQSTNIPVAQVDSYSIIFPRLDENGNPMVDKNGNIIGEPNEIAKATHKHVNPPMNDTATPGTAYQVSSQLKQPSSASGSNIVFDEHQATFASGVDILTVIQSVVMDSSYIGDTLEAFYKSVKNKTSLGSNIVDENGNIKYFSVIPKVYVNPGNNNETNQPPTKYVYMVVPRKILYNSALPGASRDVISQKVINNRVSRVYNYIYTGQNTDVLDFKIKFDALFFEELPKAMGNSTQNPSATSSSPNNSANIERNPQPSAQAYNTPQATAPQKGTYNQSSNAPDGQVNAKDRIEEPWEQIKKAMYGVINNSKSGLISGEITILGDPFFLTDASNGNSSMVSPGASIKSTVNPSTSEVNILINFRNPTDLNDGTGFMQFDNNEVAFSGMYKIISIRHEFKRGVFKQTLEIVRSPSQATKTSSQEESTPGSSWNSAANPNDQSAVNSGPIPAPVNGNQINVNAVTSLPTTTNSDPGSLSGNLSGASGAQNSVSSLYGIAPGNNTSSLGIKASAGALFAAQSSLNESAALVTSAQKVLNQAIPGTSLAQVTNVASTLNSKLSSVLNPNALAVSPSLAINQVGQNINQVLNGSVNNIANQFKINPVGLTGLTGAISGALLGSLIGSGKGKQVATALGALAGLAATIPKNVNLQQASSQGLNIEGMTQQEIKNLPPIVAPQVPNLTSFIPTTTAVGINNPLSNLTSGPLASIQSGQLGSGLYQITQATNISTSVEGIQQLTGQAASVGQSVINTVGSKTVASLSPLVNTING